jgi:hypothetical protein
MMRASHTQHLPRSCPIADTDTATVTTAVSVTDITTVA